MRVAVLVVLVSAGLVFAVLGGRIGRCQVSAQRASSGRAAGWDRPSPLMALSSDVGQTHQQVTLIDPQARVMSVYHIDRATGQIALKSVRNVRWDLLMEEFNGASPSPREIRSVLEQQ